jgi:methyltransferase family protein
MTATQTAENELAQRWRALYEARSAQQARTRAREGDFWGQRAQVFARRIDTPDSTQELILGLMNPGDVLLDVGAGAGRYAVPAAGRVREVIALEPSKGMGESLLSEAEKRNVKNIRLIQGDWLTAEAPKADVVLCAHVLYFTPDVVPFVQKLNEHAERQCIVVIRVDQASSGIGPLFEQVRGEPQAPEPSFIDLYNLLYQMGIVAEVRIAEGRNSMSSFPNLDEAEASVTQTLAPADESARAKIRPYLEQNLVRGAEGELVFKGVQRRVAIVSWRTDGKLNL